MMKRYHSDNHKRPYPYGAQDGKELFEDDFSVMSSAECTGLQPTPPQNEAEAESYSDIYDIPLWLGEKGSRAPKWRRTLQDED